MGRYRKALVEEIEKKFDEEKKQQSLREKYNIEEKNIKIVETSNMGKFTIKTIGTIVRITASIAIIILAAIGLIALIYPDTRDSLCMIGKQLTDQLKAFLP